MRILYTNSTQSNYPQINPNISLGGFVSGSPVPNDSDENLFPLVSILSEQQKRKVTRLLAIQNNSEKNYSDIKISFEFPSDTTFTYKFAISSPSLTTDGFDKYEQITNGEAVPIYATFQTIESLTQYEIGSILKDRSLGLWLIREFKSAKKGYVGVDKSSCAYWKEVFENENVEESVINEEEDEGKEYFYINLSWEEDEASISQSLSF